VIGVAISTYDRRDLALDSIERWRKHLPQQAFLVVVDDASPTPFPDINGAAVIRHDYRRGVAMTKNTGIAALMDAGCDHLFLADDDCHPVTDDWWRPYVDSTQQHLSWQWETRDPWLSTFDDGTHWAIEFPRGVLLYATHEVVDTVGGMDTAYGSHGGEHVEWQQRIHDAGFGAHPFMDVHGTSDRFWSHDRDQGGTLGSTIPLDERRHLIAANGRLWGKPQPAFVPYREGQGVQDYQLGPDLSGDHHYALLEHVTTVCPRSTAVEFGVGRGQSTQLLAAKMPTVGFDSGQGLPEDWRPEFPKGSFAHPIPTIPNTTIVEGWFADTLQAFDFTSLGHIGIVHIDCDLYSSTATVLEHIGPHLQAGTFVVFDEWHSYDGAEDHEQRAWREYADRTGIGWSVVGHGHEGWAIRIV
jgi:hypothetical protein